MGGNDEIPLALPENLVALLECRDVSLFDSSVRDGYLGCFMAHEAEIAEARPP
jgi:hypothetical protein